MVKSNDCKIVRVLAKKAYLCHNQLGNTYKFNDFMWAQVHEYKLLYLSLSGVFVRKHITDTTLIQNPEYFWII